MTLDATLATRIAEFQDSLKKLSNKAQQQQDEGEEGSEQASARHDSSNSLNYDKRRTNESENPLPSQSKKYKILGKTNEKTPFTESEKDADGKLTLTMTKFTLRQIFQEEADIIIKDFKNRQQNSMGSIKHLLGTYVNKTSKLEDALVARIEGIEKDVTELQQVKIQAENSVTEGVDKFLLNTSTIDNAILDLQKNFDKVKTEHEKLMEEQSQKIQQLEEDNSKMEHKKSADGMQRALKQLREEIEELQRNFVR